MQHATIISDELVLAQTIKNELSTAGWTNKIISVAAMIEHDSQKLTADVCVILVVDCQFLQRFDNFIIEMNAITANITRLTPLYLIFEHDYSQSFDTWLPHTTQLFKNALDPIALRSAIAEIIRKHTESVASSAYCSPMAAGF
jgi:hypothetical protein